MRTLLIATVLVFAPAFALAHAGHDLEDMMAVAQNGGVYVETHASASSGGQTASDGLTVTTGNTSASSYVQTVINSNGGNVQTRVETSRDGETQVNEYSRAIAPQKSVDVHIEAVASDIGTKSEVRADGELVAASSSSTVDSREEEDGDFFATLFTPIPTLFEKILNFFTWF